MSILNALERGTSPIDWCEFNYTHSSFIAEIFNTISNLPFLVLSPILMYLFKQYAANIDRGINVVWTLFAVVGVCSAYFHATLSLFGQLLDEFAIIWLLAFAFGMWFPKKYYPKWLNNDRCKFKKLMLGTSFAASFLACIYPWINSFVLMSLALPTILLINVELKKCQIQRVKRLGVRCQLCLTGAIVSWIFDRIFCSTWASYNAPYLHSIWHVLIAIAAYYGCVLCAYFDAIFEHEHLHPVLKYWPTNSAEMVGIAYIDLKNGF